MLESHSVPRTALSARMVATVVGALGKGTLAGKALAAKLDRAYGQRPRKLTPERRAKLLADLKLGAEAAHVGQWKKVIRLILPVKQSLERATLSVSRSRTLFAALLRARLLLSNSYLRSSQPALAGQMMAAVLRAQPDHSLSTARYGPLLVRLYSRTKAALDRQRPASLQVDSSPSGALVFLSGRYVGVSPMKLDQLYPGTYDLLLIKNNHPSRVRRIVVQGKKRVRVDLALQRAVLSEGFAGLQLEEGPGRDVREVRLAMDIATRLGASKVVLVGLRRIKGRQVLVGKMTPVTIKGVPITAYVYVDRHAPSPESLRSLGRFLGGLGSPGPGIVVDDRALRLTTKRTPSTSRPGRRRGLAIAGWTVVGVGLATALAGGVLLGIHNRIHIPSSQSRLYQTDVEGKVTLGVGLGAAAIGAGLVLINHFIRKKSRRRRASINIWLSPRRRGSAVTIGGRF